MCEKNWNVGPDSFSRFDTEHDCDRRLDGQTEETRNDHSTYSIQRVHCACYECSGMKASK